MVSATVSSVPFPSLNWIKLPSFLRLSCWRNGSGLVWCLLPPVADFPPDFKIGVLRGSNQEQWLQERDIKISQSVNQLSSLFRLLQIGRIDTFLADEICDE